LGKCWSSEKVRRVAGGTRGIYFNPKAMSTPPPPTTYNQNELPSTIKDGKLCKYTKHCADQAVITQNAYVANTAAFPYYMPQSS